jgi:hypothetical protein
MAALTSDRCPVMVGERPSVGFQWGEGLCLELEVGYEEAGNKSRLEEVKYTNLRDVRSVPYDWASFGCNMQAGKHSRFRCTWAEISGHAPSRDPPSHLNSGSSFFWALSHEEQM